MLAIHHREMALTKSLVLVGLVVFAVEVWGETPEPTTYAVQIDPEAQPQLSVTEVESIANGAIQRSFSALIRNKSGEPELVPAPAHIELIACVRGRDIPKIDQRYSPTKDEFVWFVQVRGQFSASWLGGGATGTEGYLLIDDRTGLVFGRGFVPDQPSTAPTEGE